MGFHRHFLPTSVGLLQPLRPLACAWGYSPVTKLCSCLLSFTLKTKASLAVLITDMWDMGEGHTWEMAADLSFSSAYSNI